MRQQRADLFERVTRPVKDRRGGAPKIVRRPTIIPSPATIRCDASCM
jgi:hypothetical protein